MIIDRLAQVRFVGAGVQARQRDRGGISAIGDDQPGRINPRAVVELRELRRRGDARSSDAVQGFRSWDRCGRSVREP